MPSPKLSSFAIQDMARTLSYLLFTLFLAMLFLKLLTNSFLDSSGWALSMTSEKSFQHKCERFKPRIPNSKQKYTEFLQSQQKARLTYRDVTCGGPGDSRAVSQDVCRITMYVETSQRSGIHLEAWLPADWNGRFVSTGNGGLGGCIDYNGLAYTTKHGFAAVGSNNGHNGTSGEHFYKNPDVLEDFAGRSLHTITKVGKEVVGQFYRKSHKKSYFIGCSQGGRQGIGSAEKYPGDFDGIIAGAPALDFTSLASWRASFFPLTGIFDSEDFIQPTIWSGLIHNEVLRQCDALDGAMDGIIENPDLCKFDPERLRCKPGQKRNCLTNHQVGVVRKVFSPLTYEDGTIIYPGMSPGSEQRAIDRFYAGKPFTDSQDWFRYVVHSDPSWDPSQFTVARDARESETLNPFNIKTFPSNLDPFRLNNGKIIMYHGMQDQQITPFIASRWYDYFMQETKSSPEDIDKFLRYFRISGLFHCAGGSGAWMIGQHDDSLPYDRTRNVLAAIVDWVELGIEPETIEGTSFDGKTVAAGSALTRKHCRYPKQNKYHGIHPADQPVAYTNAEDWRCE